MTNAHRPFTHRASNLCSLLMNVLAQPLRVFRYTKSASNRLNSCGPRRWRCLSGSMYVSQPYISSSVASKYGLLGSQKCCSLSHAPPIHHTVIPNGPVQPTVPVWHRRSPFVVSFLCLRPSRYWQIVLTVGPYTLLARTGSASIEKDEILSFLRATMNQALRHKIIDARQVVSCRMAWRVSMFFFRVSEFQVVQ